MVYEAEIEHGSAKELIAKIEAMTTEERIQAAGEGAERVHQAPRQGRGKGDVSQLKETELDLKELGGQLAQRKMELMEEMGIEAEEAGAEAQALGGRARGGAFEVGQPALRQPRAALGRNGELSPRRQDRQGKR